MRLILGDYWGVDGEPPVKDDREFDRRFRVPRAFLVRLYQALNDRPWWKQSVNATRRVQSHPMQNLVSALRVLAYGEETDRSD